MKNLKTIEDVAFANDRFRQTLTLRNSKAFLISKRLLAQVSPTELLAQFRKTNEFPSQDVERKSGLLKVGPLEILFQIAYRGKSAFEVRNPFKERVLRNVFFYLRSEEGPRLPEMTSL